MTSYQDYHVGLVVLVPALRSSAESAIWLPAANAFPRSGGW